ncbi:MAG: methylated-DNA--[protein]-cysteine S-methyltransferase [Chlorobia bacterium]|nr:methylated-DNA--[protein]-cysteine S-methyltransferase [Fimbriimonadaceae bacterium]
MNGYYNVIESPFGPLTPVVDLAGALQILYFGENHPSGYALNAEKTAHVERQLREYLNRERTNFDLPLNPKGTEFQHSVWRLLTKIPQGVTRSYGDLAKELGRPGASRAVGRANATNPIAIIVPCHRVIGSNGTLTGYAGGLSMKEKLLEFEQGLTARLF